MNKEELVINNNQLDNVSNRKGQPGSLGNTTTGPNDHSQADRPPAGADVRQGDTAVHESNDAAGGYPRSPGGANQLAADQKMDEDTGLSNTVNATPPVDEGVRQAQQSNVGRRSDMTPD
ncbi:MAG: hypothetical protein M3Y65_09875 [Pseudomonadota bacterium]|nr:hypothetical protein [Pseudomonadota bacterium]